MKTANKLWRALTGLATMFSSRPMGDYGQYLTDTVQYHH